jgi:hypothetical protein
MKHVVYRGESVREFDAIRNCTELLGDFIRADIAWS